MEAKTFAINQRVKVVRGTDALGEVGIIRELLSDGSAFVVINPHLSYWLWSKNLEDATLSSDAKAIKMGDVVRVKPNDNPYSESAALYGADQGKVMKLLHHDPYGMLARVEFSGGRVDEFPVSMLAIVPADEQYETPTPARVEFKEGALYRVVKEGDRYYKLCGELVSIDPKREDAYTLFFGDLNVGLYEEDYERYATHDLVPWVPTEADFEKFKADWRATGRTYPPGARRELAPYQEQIATWWDGLVKARAAKSRRAGSFTGEVPFIRVGRFLFRGSEIGAVTLYKDEVSLTLIGTEKPVYVINNKQDAARLLQWLEAQTYNLEGEDSVDY